MEIKKELLNEKEIFDSVDLCEDNGELCRFSSGWSRNSVFNCNLKGRWLRKKKWNYWCVMNKECLFSITISNIDYAGMVFAYYLDLNTKKYIEKTVMTPFGRGCHMPQTVHETVEFKHKDMSAELRAEGNDTHIIVKCNDFNGEAMEADFTVICPKDHETLNVVVPWNKKVFQFTSKQECLPVQGKFRVGDRSYSFEKENTFACLDYGRGVWPYKVSWNWANASGIVDGHIVGFNLGAKWTDGTGMTENGIVVDGKITKLSENIMFEYNPKDFMKTWSLRTEITNRVNLKFEPIFERIAKSDLAIIKSEVHQMIGFFSGEVETDDGERIHIDNMPGCSEEHYGRW